ncbi:MAG: winged helix DNA-binding protein [Oscillospiraceae bacterium]|nr:winged helix DNA-binding protein [Oscillospiraceae bacterium]
MDYGDAAEELLNVLFSVPQAKAERQISKTMRWQGFILTYLVMNHNWTHPKNLSRSMMVSSACIAAILRKLEKEAVITRTADDEDSRQVVVSLTEKGIRRAAAYRKELLESTTKMLEYLGPEDAQAYLRIRKKLLNMSAN